MIQADFISGAIVATFTLMFFSDVSLNMISLGGLALGVGMLVDNSIVVLENIFRHREKGANGMAAAIQGAKEVAMPVTASTLTTISVFFPIIYVKGVAGQLFRNQSLTVTFSLLVSLTLLPMLAAALVYMILAAQFESLVHPFVITFAVPLAAIGVVLALFVTGQSLNVMSLIGAVVLIGIVVNDAIIKVDFINQERKRGAELREAIMEAGRKRLRPIIMTAVTTVLGLLPMALGLGEGAELQRPLTLAVIGGLISATFLTRWWWCR